MSLVAIACLLAACAPLPPRLTLPALAISEPAFQSTLEAFTGAPVMGGNQVEILLNGQETFPSMLEAIGRAEKTITFETYIFRKSRVGERFIERLAERCRAGVQAAILLDAHGSGDVPPEYIDTLRQAGCTVVPDFRPLRPWSFQRSNLRTHRRIVVIDGRVGYTGGYGVDDMWEGDGRTAGLWRETNLRVEGPIVQELQAAFVEHWREATGVLLGGDAFYPYPPVAVSDERVRAQIVRSSPKRDNYALYTTFLQAISSARQSIIIATPYLIPGEQMTQALVDAVRRGVRVVVLVPALITEVWIEYLVQESQRAEFGALLDGGVQLYEYLPALMHTKAMVIDGRWATIGSTNLDNRSMAVNDELNVVMYDEPVAERLEQILLEDLAHARKITREGLRRRSWLGHFLAFVTSPIRKQF